MPETHSHYGLRSQRIPATYARSLRLSAKTISEKTISPAPVRKLSAKTRLPRAPNAARARQIDAPRGRLTY